MDNAAMPLQMPNAPPCYFRHHPPGYAGSFALFFDDASAGFESWFELMRHVKRHTRGHTIIPPSRLSKQSNSAKRYASPPGDSREVISSLNVSFIELPPFRHAARLPASFAAARIDSRMMHADSTASKTRHSNETTPSASC